LITALEPSTVRETQLLSETFNALNKEAQFTREMLGSGATQIRNANYASKGIYFQAFTSLSTGLERIGKLCLMLDHYIDQNGKFPDFKYMREEICHNIVAIYEKSTSVAVKHSISMKFLQGLSDPIHQAILSVLSEFARGDRYSNINLLVGGGRQTDPIASWFEQVDRPLYETRVSQRKKDTIRNNSLAVASMLGQHAMVLHTSEMGEEITDIEKASHMTGVYKAVAPYRQLCVLQVIRYWVELLSSLQYIAMGAGSQDIPFFTEIFAPFFNDDAYIRTRKTWEKLSH
jgi:hypothetical protein